MNLSARLLEHDEVVSTLRQALHRTGISPHQVGLEITEATLHGGTVTTNRNLGRMRELGVTLSIDDFGTGNSSLPQSLGSHAARAGGDAAQGFLFGHPVLAEEIDRLFDLPTPVDDVG